MFYSQNNKKMSKLCKIAITSDIYSSNHEYRINKVPINRGGKTSITIQALTTNQLLKGKTNIFITSTSNQTN